MTDADAFIDLTDTESYGTGYDPVPRGWYTCVISDWEASEVKKENGKFPQGTPGTNWELTIDEGEYENRKLWINHWHHSKSLPFLKGFLEATGKFEADELSGRVDINDARDRALGARIQARAVVRPAKGEYDARNDVKAVKPVGAVVSDSGNNSLLP
jgi:hypothetical protein